jgi:hypothetical protein
MCLPLQAHLAHPRPPPYQQAPAQLRHIPVVDSVYTDGMDRFLLSINQYIHDETPDFRQFYNWFQNAYFGDQNRNDRNRLQQDEIDFLNTVDDFLAYAGADPTPEERNDGINDQYEFQQQLRALKSQSIPLWTRYGLH